MARTHPYSTRSQSLEAHEKPNANINFNFHLFEIFIEVAFVASLSTLANWNVTEIGSHFGEIANLWKWFPWTALDLPWVMAKLTLKGSCQKETLAKSPFATPLCHFQFEEWSEKATLPRKRFMGKPYQILENPHALKTGKSGKVLTGCLGFFSFLRWVTFTAIKCFCAVNLIILGEVKRLIQSWRPCKCNCYISNLFLLQQFSKYEV